MNIVLADLTWGFNKFFHIDCGEHGCFEWSNPDYGGDDNIKPAFSYEAWCTKRDIPYGRNKGIVQFDIDKLKLIYSSTNLG